MPELECICHLQECGHDPECPRCLADIAGVRQTNPTAQLVSALEQASAKLSGAGYCPEQACAEAQTIIDAALTQSKAIEPSKDEVERVRAAIFRCCFHPEERDEVIERCRRDWGEDAKYERMARAAIAALSSLPLSSDAIELETLKHDFDRLAARENYYVNECEHLRRVMQAAGSELQRLRESAASADRGEGASLSGMSKEERRKALGTQPQPGSGE